MKIIYLIILLILHNILSYRKLNLLCALVPLCLCAFILHAQESELSSMQFLRISPSPRASALGNSYTSILGNSDTLFYNPGSLGFFKLTTPIPNDPDKYSLYNKKSEEPFFRNMSFSVAYSKWFFNMNYLAFSSMFDIRKVGVMGIGFTTMLYPDIAETTSTGPDSYSITGRNLSSSGFNFMLTYATMLGQSMGLGGSIKTVIENLAGDSIMGMALDAGIIYHATDSKWSAGFVIQNAGLPVKKISHQFQLPLNFKLGGNYLINIIRSNPDTHIIMITGDLGKGLDYDYLFSLGLEYGFKKMVFVRTGYQYHGDEPGWKAGMGVKYKNFDVDYAFVMLNDLGDFGFLHKIGLTYRLKPEIPLPGQEDKKEKVSKEVTDRGIEIALNDIIFEFNKAELKPDYISLLDEAIDIINDYKNYDIVIEGHTDAIGTEEYNFELSKERAKKVYEYLTQKNLDPKRITYIGYGKSKPVADNITEEGREKNRRVYIVLVKKLSPQEKEKYNYHFYNGMDYYIKEGYQLAIKEWEKALKIRPHDPKAKNWISKAKKKLKRK